MNVMKKTAVVAALTFATVCVRAALPQPEILVQIHFAGGVAVAADKNYAAFKNEFSSPEAVALRQQTAGKLARFFAQWFAQVSGSAAPAGATALRPLLDDLQNDEWFLDVRDVNGKAEAALAVKTANAQRWQSALQPFFPAASFQSADGWTVFRTGAKAPDLAGKILALNGAWLSLDVNWPALGKFFPSVRTLDLPETKFSFAANATDFKIDGKFFFPQNLTAVADAWQLPAKIMDPSFVSFTAVRGIAGWLGKQPWLPDWPLNPVPNQIFSWGLPNAPFQWYAAVPRADATAALQQAVGRLEPKLAAAYASHEIQVPLTLSQSGKQAKLTGLPMFAAPYLEAVDGAAGQFLLAGGFPTGPVGSRPLPPEIFKQLAQKNLFYYHWEVTAECEPGLLQLSQFSLMVTRHKQLGDQEAAFKWIQMICPKLGNCVTEVRQTAPDQMTFSRKAPGALTTAEFFALANWLESENFPGCKLKLSPLGPHSVKRPATPAPGK